MEGFKSPEEREGEIDRLIENFAEAEKTEGFGLEEIQSDMATFVQLGEEDPDALAYFEEIAEKIGISTQELIEYARKKSIE